MIQSKFKNLLVSGCSFTHNNCEGHFAWPNILSVWTGMNTVNLAIPGAGNSHIANSVLLYLEKEKPSPADTLVLIMWSGVERIDWITDKAQSNFGDQYSYEYFYDDYTELTVGGAWWSQSPTTHLKKTLVEYSKYQSDQSLALASWLEIKKLETYLGCKGYTFYFTSFLDIFNEGDGTNTWIRFDKELEKLNLTLDKSVWLPMKSSEYLGNYIKEHNMVQDFDRFHPTMAGNESWLNTILIPKLLEQGVLTDGR